MQPTHLQAQWLLPHLKYLTVKKLKLSRNALPQPMERMKIPQIKPHFRVESIEHLLMHQLLPDRLWGSLVGMALNSHANSHSSAQQKQRDRLL